jgi:ribosomal protein S18 acetylase RimI-like enzyme
MNDLRRAGPADREAALALQWAAFERNVPIMDGAMPLPLRADYEEIFATHEVWLVEGDAALEGMLILLPREDDLYIWSIATDPAVQGTGVGKRMLAAAEARAVALGLTHMRLRTSQKLAGNIAWYRRHGFAIERTEELADRTLVHMLKTIG